MWNSIKLSLKNSYQNYLLISISSVIYLFSIYYTEKNPFFGGTGWDGLGYFEIAVSYDAVSVFREKKLPMYRLQRIVPSLAVHYELGVINKFRKILGFSTFPYDKTHTIWGFLWLNTLILLASQWLWLRILDQAKVQFRTKLLGFLAMFGSFALLKQPFYLPIQTDYMAFGFGLLFLYAYLQKMPLLIVFLSILGFFCFPTLLVMGGILLLKDKNFIEKDFFLQKIDKFFIWAVLIFILCLAIWFQQQHYPPSGNSTPINLWLFPLSIAALCGYIGFLGTWFGRTKLFLGLFSKHNLLIISLFVLLFVLLRQFIFYFSNGKVGILTTADFFKNIFHQSLANPLAFWVSHFFYFSPLLLFLFLYTKRFVLIIKQLGFGYFVLVVCFLGLMIGSETRQFINFYPFLLFPLLLLLDSVSFSSKTVAFLVFLIVLYSKIWYPINQEPFLGEAYWAFPWQHYFMHFGAWMSNEVYYVKFLIVGITIWGLKIGFLDKKKFHSDQEVE